MRGPCAVILIAVALTGCPRSQGATLASAFGWLTCSSQKLHPGDRTEFGTTSRRPRRCTLGNLYADSREPRRERAAKLIMIDRNARTSAPGAYALGAQ